MSKISIDHLHDPEYRKQQAATNYNESAPYILAFFAGHNSSIAMKNYKDASAPFSGEYLQAFNKGFDEGSKAR